MFTKFSIKYHGANWDYQNTHLVDEGIERMTAKLL